MSTVASASPFASKRWSEPDRIGVIASVLCAIHCALTPFLLLLLPTFGKAWSHPASHWGMALVVVPVAAFTLTRGFRQHRRRWVVASGVLGIVLVLVGAAVPYLNEHPATTGVGSLNAEPAVAVASVAWDKEESQSTELPGEEAQPHTQHSSEGQCASECESEEQCASECESEQFADTTSSEQCEDLCCPTLQASADGGWKLNIPLASILTTLGGISLIATHLGNLCCCATCKKPTQTA